MLAVLYTWTTYGTWLRGDARGWVRDGVTFPVDPPLEAADRQRLRFPPWLFARADLLRVGGLIGESLGQRAGLTLYALTVQPWHVHVVTAVNGLPFDRVVKCAKDAVRWGLRPSRPIWTDGYDKRFCFDETAVLARVAYVERHNVEAGWEPRPWEFLTPLCPS
ncbi:MAG: hypothetical protein U0736_10090 [Gemmataceae bacterium]